MLNKYLRTLVALSLTMYDAFRSNQHHFPVRAGWRGFDRFLTGFGRYTNVTKACMLYLQCVDTGTSSVVFSVRTHSLLCSCTIAVLIRSFCLVPLQEPTIDCNSDKYKSYLVLDLLARWFHALNPIRLL